MFQIELLDVAYILFIIREKMQRKQVMAQKKKAKFIHTLKGCCRRASKDKPKRLVAIDKAPQINLNTSQ